MKKSHEDLKREYRDALNAWLNEHGVEGTWFASPVVQLFNDVGLREVPGVFRQVVPSEVSGVVISLDEIGHGEVRLETAGQREKHLLSSSEMEEAVAILRGRIHALMDKKSMSYSEDLPYVAHDFLVELIRWHEQNTEYAEYAAYVAARG